MSHAISFAYRGLLRHLFLTMHVDTPSSGIVEKYMCRGRYFCEVQSAIIVRGTNGYGSRYQEPNLESACLDHGKPC